MYQYKIILIDFFDGFGEESSFFVDHLSVCDDFRFRCGALMIFFVQFREILVDEKVVVEGNWVFIRLIPVDDNGELIAFLVVDGIFMVVLFFLSEIVFEFVDASIAFVF